MPVPLTPHRAEPTRAVGRYLRVIVPALLFWAGLVTGAAFLLYDRSRWSEKYDRAAVREWLEERRPNRKNLSDLIDEYLQEPSEEKTKEIEDQFDAMMEPLRMFRSGTPLFLDLYTIRVTFPDRPNLASLEWRAPDRPSRAAQGNQVRTEPLLDYRARDGSRVVVSCEYRMHAFHKAQQEEAERQRWVWLIGAVVLGGSVLGILSVATFMRRERRREVAELHANQALEHAENLALAEELRAQEAIRAKEEADRNLLEQRLEVARQENRAAEAEKTNFEMKSQLYASIGIMAGSYAHNIKNLLVRPNDLLARCIQQKGATGDQTNMLEEVRSTLGTVTERLQQILRTVRRDPNKADLSRIDMNELVREMERTWAEMAEEKWKLLVMAETTREPLVIQGDRSHLQQAVENLIFNARDATFEMRNHLRDAARAITDPGARKHALIESAAWKGQVTLRARREGVWAVLEIQDNGIGMTEEVRQRCVQTHFSTKRDNALYEGYSAGMGLGLSFVVVVLEHHQAELAIESQANKGATFRIRFPLADS